MDLQVEYSGIPGPRAMVFLVDGFPVGLASLAPAFDPQGGRSGGATGGDLGQTYLRPGLHQVGVTLDGTAALDQAFFLAAGACLWIEIGQASAHLGLGVRCPAWI